MELREEQNVEEMMTKSRKASPSRSRSPNRAAGSRNTLTKPTCKSKRKASEVSHAADAVPAATRKALADPRCPPVGTVMERTVRGKDGKSHTCQCTVMEDGFRWRGRLYRTPTPVATLFMTEVVGCAPKTRRSGWEFFFPGTAVPAAKRLGRRAKAASSHNIPPDLPDDPDMPDSDSAEAPACPAAQLSAGGKAVGG